MSFVLWSTKALFNIFLYCGIYANFEISTIFQACVILDSKSLEKHAGTFG